MSDILSRIKSPSDLVENQGAKILMYGAAGAGKTTSLATSPGKTLIISTVSYTHLTLPTTPYV